jgi:hypothetical protein
VTVTTTKILALKALERRCGQECVDWAITMLEQGASQKSIGVLAGMTPPFNHFEMASLRDRALLDVGASKPTHSLAIQAYAGELALEALAGDIDTFRLLEELAELCIAEGYASELYDCYLLHFAWLDLRRGEVQWYWPGATQENIDQLVKERLTALAVASASIG